jgi:hypothetical protein
MFPTLLSGNYVFTQLSSQQVSTQRVYYIARPGSCMYTVPFQPRSSRSTEASNVLLATTNTTLAKHWGARKHMSFAEMRQQAALLGLPLVVVTNAYCDVEGHDTWYELCYKRKAPPATACTWQYY